jgi:hypothetical protein
LDAARRDAGRAYSTQASIATLTATDAAMKVAADAVQVFGGVGYTCDYRVDRYIREAKIMQIFEGHQPDSADGRCPLAEARSWAGLEGRAAYGAFPVGLLAAHSQQ